MADKLNNGSDQDAVIASAVAEKIMSGINSAFGNAKASRNGTDIVVNVKTDAAIKEIDGLEAKIKNLQKLAATNQNSTRTKLSLFGDIDKVGNNLKKSWNEFVSYTQAHGVNVFGNDGKFNYSSIRDFNQTSKRLMGDVFKHANMFEAVTGDSSGISAISSQLMDFVQGLRELPNNLNNPNNLAGMQEIVNMLREIQTLANSGDTKIPDILSQLGIKELTSALEPAKNEIQSIMEFATRASDQASQTAEDQAEKAEQAAEREAKAYKTLEQIRAEAESRRGNRRTYADDEDYNNTNWNYQLDQEKNALERYNSELENLLKERDRILEEAESDHIKAIRDYNKGDDNGYNTWINYYNEDLEKYQEIADRIDYVQEHLNQARLDFKPGDSWGGDEIKVTIQLLQELVQQIQQVAQAFGTVDDEAGIGTLLSQLKDMRAGIDGAFSPAKLESFSSTLSGIAGKLESISASIGTLGEGDKSQMSIRGRLQSMQKRIGQNQLNVNVNEDKSLDTVQMQKQEEVKWDSYLRRYTNFYKQISDIAAKYADGQMGSQTYLMNQMTNSREILEQFSSADDLIAQFGGASVNDPTKSAKERVQIIMEFFKYLRTAQQEISANGKTDGFWGEVGALLDKKNFPSTDMSYINSQIKEIYDISSVAGQRKPLKDQVSDLLGAMSGGANGDVSQIDALIQSLGRLQAILAQGFGITNQEQSITFFEQLAQSMLQVADAVDRINGTIGALNEYLSTPQNAVLNITPDQVAAVTDTFNDLKTVLQDIKKLLGSLDFSKLRIADAAQKVTSEAKNDKESEKTVSDKIAEASMQNANTANTAAESIRNESSAAVEATQTMNDLADATDRVTEAQDRRNDSAIDLWRTTTKDKDGNDVVSYRGKSDAGTFQSDADGNIISHTEKVADGYTKAKEEAKALTKEAKQAEQVQAQILERAQAEQQKAGESFIRQQATWESRQAEAQAKESFAMQQKQLYDELTNTVNRYAEVRKRLAGDSPFETDAKEAEELFSTIDSLIKKIDEKGLTDKKLENKALRPFDTLDWKEQDIRNRAKQQQQKKADKSSEKQDSQNEKTAQQRAKDIQSLADAYIQLGKAQANFDKHSEEIYNVQVQKAQRNIDQLEKKLGNLTTDEQKIIQSGKDSGSLIRRQEKAKLEAPVGNFKDAATGYDTLTKNAQRYYTLLAKQAQGSDLTVGQQKWLAEMSSYYEDAMKQQNLFDDQSEKSAEKQKEFAEAIAKTREAVARSFTQSLQNDVDAMPAASNRTEEYAKDLQALQQSVAEFNATPINWDEDGALEKFFVKFNDFQKRMNELRTGDQYKIADELGIETLSRRMSDWINNNSAAGAFADQVKTLQSTLTTGISDEQLQQVATAFEQIRQKAADAGATGKSFGEMLKGSFGNLARYLMSFASFYRIVDVLKQGVGVVKELDTQLVEMMKVSDESMKTLQNYQLTTFDAADQVGTTAKQIQSSTADWMRLGEGLSQAAQSAKESTLLMNVSEFSNIDDATESLVAMSQAYQELDKIEIIDKLNNIGKCCLIIQ